MSLICFPSHYTTLCMLYPNPLHCIPSHVPPACAILASHWSRSGAGDCTSNAGVMSELVRNLAVKAAGGGYVNAVIFLWNTGEEEGLMGAHAFMTQVGSRLRLCENGKTGGVVLMLTLHISCRLNRSFSSKINLCTDNVLCNINYYPSYFV